MTVPEYLRRLRDTLTDSDDAKRVGDTLSEIAARWEKMEIALETAHRQPFSSFAQTYNALAAARAPLGEKTDQD